VSYQTQVMGGLVKVVVFGTVVAIPLIIGMALIFQKYGLIAALAFCVITDFADAFAMREISMKAGIETFILALFVILGIELHQGSRDG